MLCCCLTLHARLQEPELLETLYVTQQMAPEAAELALETALRTLSNAVSTNGSTAGAASPDSAVTSAISGLQEASHKYAQVCAGEGHNVLSALWPHFGLLCLPTLRSPHQLVRHMGMSRHNSWDPWLHCAEYLLSHADVKQ
jgi:hypothetical protein